MNEPLDFKKLSIQIDIVDRLMDFYHFTNHAQMFESAILVLDVLTQGCEMGAKRLLFEKVNEKGEYSYILLDLLKLIEYIKSNPDSDNTHSVKINLNKI